jgi:hypothetical protein
MPKPVCEGGDVTVLWNQAAHAYREVTANMPDIIIKNKKEKTCTLIDVAIPADRNVAQKEVRKKLKYKSLIHYYIMPSLHNTRIQFHYYNRLYSATCFGSYPDIIRPTRNSVN